MRINVISLLLVLMIVACQCSLAGQRTQRDNRMKLKIPDTAKWLGGKDGGVWVNITIESINLFSIRIYNESNGDIIDDEFYETECVGISPDLIFDSLIGYGDKLIWTVEGIAQCSRRVSPPLPRE